MDEMPQIQTMPIQTLDAKDFAGGITDYYIGGAPNKYQAADNLLIQQHGTIGKLVQRPGSQNYDVTHYQIPPGAQRIAQLKYYVTPLISTLLYLSSRKLYYVSGSFTELTGPSANSLFPAAVDTTSVISIASWNNRLYLSNDAFTSVQFIYTDNGGGLQLRTAGMPPLASAPTCTPGAAGTAHSYLYRFIYTYSYSTGGILQKDLGHATEVAMKSLNAIATGSGNPTAISAIPAIANSTTENYDTAGGTLYCEIYRTTDGGTNFFFVGAALNGTATFSDSVTDAILQTNAPLYTESGVPDNDPPPPCKSMHIVQGRAYYVNCKVGGIAYPTRIYQSSPGAPAAVPATFFHDCRDTLVAVSSTRDLPIALGQNEVYRLDNGIDELGDGDITPVSLTINGGCVSAPSVVQTPEGIWWAGNDGFYYCDGYNVNRVTSGIDQTYAKIVATQTQKNRIVGKYDANKRRIYWTAQGSGQTDCDRLYVLDLNWGISADMPVTTFSGGADNPSNFAPTAIEFVGTSLIRGDSRGYTFQHLDTLYTDPKVNTSTAASTWNQQAIIYNHLSIATDFGDSGTRKWVTRCGVVCQNDTPNLSLQINSINDNKTGSPAALQPVRYVNTLGLIDAWRRFPAKNLRCEYKQIQLTNAKVAIVNSDTLGTCNVATGGLTATLTAGTWPVQVTDYVIAFANDGYVQEFTISTRTSGTVIVFTDPGSHAANLTGTAWVIRGKPRGEFLHLISYTLHYAMLGKTQAAFHVAGSGEVGT